MSLTEVRYYRGHSMGRGFALGDRLEIEAVSTRDLRVGDVVVFRRSLADGTANDVIHRVVEVTGTTVVTRGDANPASDPEAVSDEVLVGRVLSVRSPGGRRFVAKGPAGALASFRIRIGIRLRRSVAKALHGPYRALRASGLVKGLWNASFLEMSVTTARGRAIRFVRNGRTVATWWPDLDLFACRRPYDLVLRPRIEGRHAHRDATSALLAHG